MCDACSDDIKTIIDADVAEIVQPYLDKHENHRETFESIRMKLYYQQANAISGFPEKMVIKSWESLIKSLDSTVEAIEQESENPKAKKTMKIAMTPFTKPNEFVALEDILKAKQDIQNAEKMAQQQQTEPDIDAILSKLMVDNPFENEAPEAEDCTEPED